YLEMVKASADSLLTIINDVLDFSKIEAGKLALDPIDFKLRECLNDTIKPLMLRAHQKGLMLNCHIAPAVPEALVGDPYRLRQILINLIGNAIKFTEAGAITVIVSQLEDGGWGLEDRAASNPASIFDPASIFLHFAVSDTGVGIQPEKQRMIFEAFQQADGSTTRKHGGTGLGLTISSRLVELMNGQIGVESVMGEGSTFYFTAQFGRAITLLEDDRALPRTLSHTAAPYLSITIPPPAQAATHALRVL